MPKIVSNSTVATTDANEADNQPLKVYYCLCGEYILIIDCVLDSLPRRKTDHAIILPRGQRHYKVNVKRGETVMLKRPNGYEKQYRLLCPRCQVIVAYEANPNPSGEYTYILDGAISATQ
ncbi:hypothetical protein K493DRAFT_176342, partial [Basidiobolus meristosporus CBS 931.73]